jgi:hypothetical protein
MLTKAVPSPSYDADKALLDALGLVMRAPFVNSNSPRAAELAEQVGLGSAPALSVCEMKGAACAMA